MEFRSGQRLVVSVLEDAEKFAALEEEWDDLYRHSPWATPFQSWAWLYSWWEAYGQDYGLRLVEIRADGLLVGLLPMMLERNRGFGKLLFVGTGLTDYNDVLVRQGWEAPVSEAGRRALAEVGGWRVIELQELRPAAAGWDLFRGWEGPKTSFRQSVCPIIEVRPWDELLASVSRNLRQTTRRTLRKMEADGLRLRRVEPAGMERAARRWIALHRESWRGRGIAGEHETEEFESFLTVAARRMAERDLATISEFWRDGEAIISLFWVFGPDFVGGHLTGATQEALQRYQVSSLSVWEGVHRARSRNVPCLDMLRGEEPYKLRWNPKMVPNHRVILGRDRLHFGLYAGYRALRATARRYARSEDAPRWLRMVIDRLRKDRCQTHASRCLPRPGAGSIIAKGYRQPGGGARVNKPGQESLPVRVLGRIRRHGLKETVGKAVELARIRVYLKETHVIYELPLDGELPERSLPPEFELVKGDENHLPFLGQLSDISEHAARRLLESGNELWLVLEGREAAFACWILRDAMLISAAKNGRLKLPPEIVCLEDSVASPLYRGRGIAPTAWAQIAKRLQGTGVRYIVTKIEEDNVASRTAVEKIGFRQVATVRFRRVGPAKTTVVQTRTGDSADWLAERFVSDN